MQKRQTPVEVVPSCVDLEFFPSRATIPGAGELIRLLYAGTIGTTVGGAVASGLGVSHRYRLDEMARFAAAGLRRGKKVELRVLTRAPQEIVAQILAGAGLESAHWSSAAVSHAQMPGELGKAHAGLHFMAPGRASHAGSPTKTGEYWASGLPVVCTPGLGDTGIIIERENVGVLVAPGSEEMALERAWDELERLWRDPQTPARCRQAAETHYSLEAACARQWEIYENLC